MRRLLAAVLLGALCFAAGYAAGARRPVGAEPPGASEVDYTTYDAAQLSWVAEGIMERISELQDELERVQEIQRNKG